jgi:hypothetical protein
MGGSQAAPPNGCNLDPRPPTSFFDWCKKIESHLQAGQKSKLPEAAEEDLFLILPSPSGIGCSLLKEKNKVALIQSTVDQQRVFKKQQRRARSDAVVC